MIDTVHEHPRAKITRATGASLLATLARRVNIARKLAMYATHSRRLLASTLPRR